MAADVSCDGFLDGRIRVLQPRKGPRAAIDALFLAAAVPVDAGTGQRALEAGTGGGVASLALAARAPDIRITGVEVQPELAELARRNVSLNGMQDRISIIEADVTAPLGEPVSAALEPESFDHVMANPPFHASARSRVSPDDALARAHALDAGDLQKWVRFLARMARPRGTVTLIYRADALGQLIDYLAPRFGALSVFPLFPREGEPASRIVVQGIKGSRAPLTLMQGMVLHEANGDYTARAEAVLRRGERLLLAQGI